MSSQLRFAFTPRPLMAATLALLLTACGGGGSSSSSSATASTGLPANCVSPAATTPATGTDPRLVALAGPNSCGFSATSVTLRQPAAMAEDASGNLYIADTGNDTIREVSFTGVSSTLAGSAGLSGSADGTGAVARFNAPAGIAVDSSGNLYVADTGNSTLRKLVSNGSGGWVVSTIAGSAGQVGAVDGSNALSARFDQPQGLSLDASGNLYIADTGNESVRELASNGVVSTLAGSAGLPGSSEGTGAAARFKAPADLVYDAVSGTLYVADTGNDSIRQLTPSGNVWTSSTIAGVAGVTGSADGQGTAIRFSGPTGIAVDSLGNLYVSDTGNDTVRVLNISSSIWLSTTLAGVAGQRGNSDTVPGNFSQPAGITEDATGTIYVLDRLNNSLRRVNTSNQPATLSTLAGSAGQPGSTDGVVSIPTMQTLLPATGMSSDSSGNLYIPDLGNNFVREVSTAGQSTVVAGTPGVFGFSDGPGAEGSFNYPTDIARDSHGNLFVADFSNRLVRKISPDGTVVTLAGNASATPAIVDGIGSGANFYEPWAITVDSNDNVYVTDLHTVREVTQAGSVTTIAGDGNINDDGGSANGVGSAALFNYPEGIAADSAGNLYVADSGNATIRLLTPSTSGGTTVWTVSTLAGTAGSVGSADGTTKALFNDPYRLALDGNGNIFVTDRGNATIRKVVIASKTVSTVLGKAGSTSLTTGALSSATLVSPTAIAVLPGGQLAILDSGELLVTEGASF